MARQQVFFIHGANSYSNYEDFLEHLKTAEIRDLPDAEPMQKWTNTFREDLGDDFEVFMPSMPNKQNAKYQEWKIWFERHFEYFEDNIILVGWSLGGYFLVKYLIENGFPVQIKKLILLASPFEPDDFGGEDGGDFAFDTSKVSELQNQDEKIVIMHSEDDPVVPYNHALKFKEKLPQAEFISFQDKNHFLVPELPELLTSIRD